MTNTNGRVLIIDGHGLAFRAFYAVPPLSAPDGAPTNVVLGFMNMLLKVEESVTPNACAVVFDAPGPTFRHELYGEYKAQRKPTPDDFREQLPLLRELLTTLGYPVFSEPGVEADDVIASMALAAAREGREAVIVSSDKDLFQVLGPGVKMLRPVKGITSLKEYDEKIFTEEFGFPPSSMADYLALLGDASDNVPGVAGIGEKTALQLIGKAKTLEGLYKLIEEKGSIKEVTARKLAVGKERAFQSRELVRLRTALLVPSSPRKTPPDLAGALALCQRLSLRKLVEKLKALGLEKEKSLEESAGSAPEAVLELGWAEPFPLVTDKRTEDVEIKRLLESDSLALLLAHSGHYPPDPGTAELYFADAGGRCSLVRGIELDPSFWTSLERKKLFVNDYKDLVACFGPEKFQGCGIWDLKTAHYLLHPDRPTHTLADLYPTEVETISAFHLWRAARELNLELYRYQQLPDLMEQVDLPLVPVLVGMERGGIRLSLKVFAALRKELEARLAVIEREVSAAAGEEINLNSPKQVAWLLFDRLGFPSGAKTKGKTGFSTSASVLESLADLPHAEVPRLTLEHRELSKMLTGFVTPLQKAANLGGGVVRTTFEAAFTGTGRLSSREPNLQNLPAFGQWARRIKEGLIPLAPDRVFVAADYSQIELRVLAHFSGEERLLEAFQQGRRDIHRETASWVFATASEDVTPELRRVAKMINFGLLYGMSSFGLADRLGIERSEASSVINRYFAALPGVKRYLEESAAKAQKRGYTQTLFGRIRPIAEAMEGVRDRGGLKRVAINTPIQGTAADIARKAMLDFARRFALDGEVRLFLQVHDSLVCECPENRAGEVGEALAELMRSAVSLAVPLEVALKTGRTFADV
ncbi:MAG: DNA polymerase I [Synergistaceae bacterium]|nr:DNA polymerase I [Synergistaceae bacterium]